MNKALTLETLRKGVIEAQYAVRGFIPQTADQIKVEIAKGSTKYPFKNTVGLNIGNPQAVGNKPFEFHRQVLSALLVGQHGQIDSLPYHEDVKRRAKFYFNSIGAGSNVGAYSASPGYAFVNKNIAKFIQRRDGCKDLPDPSKISLTDGASNGITLIVQALSKSHDVGIMIPIPQYPLYSALLALNEINMVNYYLDESKGWGLATEELDRSLNEAKAKGIQTRAITVINPGNPTGQVLDREVMENVVRWCYDNKIMILADEVYQRNIYKQGKKFTSFRKVVTELPAPYNTTELISFHSASKGTQGDCGFRGGYMEFLNIEPKVQAELNKLKTMFLCSNTIGQIVVDLMVNPPNKEEGCSDYMIQKHKDEEEAAFQELKKRGQIVTQSLNSMKNVKSNEVEGAMYAFPQIFLSDKAIAAAKEMKLAADTFYCYQMLLKTGVVVVQGSGFNQVPGTWHYRISNLVGPTSKFAETMQNVYKFNEWFHQTY
eukprot:TRINITY_DN13_c0_g1_i1.p1 TRINITY_DN13_c0_g1~~TRINITY_DN13_c0_g1_i1.p1  ORF type:complete len:487 (+),score=175.39 TRINITY_DN13_c0_g1_i1:167-1627(+)